MKLFLILILATTLLPADGGAKLTVCLSDTYASPFEAVNAVLASISRNEQVRARAAAVSRDEFTRVVWPELPVSRPGSTFTADFVWQQHALREEFSFAKAWKRHAGRAYQLTAVDLGSSVSDHATFRVYTRPVLKVIDEHGEERSLRLIGSIIEQDGRYKIYGFNTD